MDILKVWNQLSSVPGIGKALFHRALQFMVPYTFSIYPEILELRQGYARIAMKDRRLVRNHLRSVHAIALTNLAEVTSGLAMLTACPTTHQAILKRLEVDFVKKARGRLVAESHAPKDVVFKDENVATFVEAQIFDESQNLVAQLKATWVVGPKKKKEKQRERNENA